MNRGNIPAPPRQPHRQRPDPSIATELKRRLNQNGITHELDEATNTLILITTPDLAKTLGNARRDLDQTPSRSRQVDQRRIEHGRTIPARPPPAVQETNESSGSEESDEEEMEAIEEIRKKRDWTVDRVLNVKRDEGMVKVSWAETITHRSGQRAEHHRAFFESSGKRFFPRDVQLIASRNPQQPRLRLKWAPSWIPKSDLSHPEAINNINGRPDNADVSGPCPNRIHLIPCNRETDHYPELRREIERHFKAPDGKLRSDENRSQKCLRIGIFLTMPVVRQVRFNVLTPTNFLREEFAKAVLTHATGSAVSIPCDRCAAGDGLLQGCIVNVDEKKPWNNGACTNCVLSRKQSSKCCSFHRMNPVQRAPELVNEDGQAALDATWPDQTGVGASLRDEFQADNGSTSPAQPNRRRSSSSSPSHGARLQVHGATVGSRLCPKLTSTAQQMSGGLGPGSSPAQRAMSSTPGQFVFNRGTRRQDGQLAQSVTPKRKRDSGTIDLTSSPEPPASSEVQNYPTPPSSRGRVRCGNPRIVWNHERFSPGELKPEHVRWLFRNADPINRENLEAKMRMIRRERLQQGHQLESPIEAFLDGAGLDFTNDFVIPWIGKPPLVVE